MFENVIRTLFLFSALCISCSPAARSQTPSAASPSSDRHKMISWVVLANSYRDLSVDDVRQKLDDVFPGQYLPPRQKGNFVVAGPARGQFMIFSGIAGAAGIFLMNNIPGPYTHFSKFAEAISDKGMRSRGAKQCCWLSVDLIRRTTTDDEAYRFIEQVLAKMAPADAAFLVDPEKGSTIAFDDSVRDRFTKGEKILSSP